MYCIVVEFPPLGCRGFFSINSIPTFWKCCAWNFLFSVTLFVSALLSSFPFHLHFTILLSYWTIHLYFFKKVLSIISKWQFMAHWFFCRYLALFHDIFSLGWTPVVHSAVYWSVYGIFYVLFKLIYELLFNKFLRSFVIWEWKIKRNGWRSQHGIVYLP